MEQAYLNRAGRHGRLQTVSLLGSEPDDVFSRQITAWTDYVGTVIHAVARTIRHLGPVVRKDTDERSSQTHRITGRIDQSN